MLIGELGFVLLLLEGGLEVQLSVMQALAVRAALVALTGAACVCLLGTGVGVFIVGEYMLSCVYRETHRSWSRAMLNLFFPAP